jgi:hypothetical protein
MAEKFTVYAFQLRPDDFTRFVGGFDEDTESYSEEEFSNIFGGEIEKQNISDMAADVQDDEVFSIDRREDENTPYEELYNDDIDIFNVEDEDIFNLEI